MSRIAPRCARLLLAAFCFPFVLPVTGCNQQTKSAQRPSSMINPQQVCLGRLRMTVPGPGSIAFSHAEYEGAVLDWAQLQPGQSFAKAWQEHVDQLQGDKTIEQNFAPSPRRLGAVYKTRYRPDTELHNLEIWQDDTPHILKVSGEFTTPQAETVRRYVMAALDTFQEHPDGRPGAHEFCVAGGAIKGNSQFGESMRAQIESPLDLPAAPDERFLLEVFTQVNSKAEPITLPDRIEKAMGPLRQQGASVRVLRRGERTVAGLKGYEIITLETGGRGNRYGLNAQFEYGGLPARIDAPQMTFFLDHDYPGTVPYQDLLAIWDAVLQSARIEK